MKAPTVIVATLAAAGAGGCNNAPKPVSKAHGRPLPQHTAAYLDSLDQDSLNAAWRKLDSLQKNGDMESEEASDAILEVVRLSAKTGHLAENPSTHLRDSSARRSASTPRAASHAGKVKSTDGGPKSR